MVVVTTPHVLRVLRLYANLEWFRATVGVDERDGLFYPPMIVWRFAGAVEGVKESFADVLDQFAGSVEWIFSSAGRNWSLMPNFLEWKFSSSGPTVLTVISEIKASEQALCKLATQDLDAILRGLEERAPRS